MLTLKRFFIADITLLSTCLAVIWFSFERPAIWATNASLIGPYLPLTETESVPETKPEPVAEATEIVPIVAETSKKEATKTRATKRRLSSKVLIPGGPDTIPYLAYDPLMLKAMYEQANYLRR